MAPSTNSTQISLKRAQDLGKILEAREETGELTDNSFSDAFVNSPTRETRESKPLEPCQRRPASE